MVDFTGGTWRSLIDGSEVAAIPDEAVAQYISSDYDEDNETWDDRVGEIGTLTGTGPTLETDELNGEPVVDFVEGDVLDSEDGLFEQPNTISIVAKNRKSGFSSYIDSQQRHQLRCRGDDEEFDMFAEGDTDSTVNTHTVGEFEILIAIFDDGDSKLFRNDDDGDEVTENIGTNPLEGLLLGHRSGSSGDDQLDAQVAEIAVFDGKLADSEISEEFSRLNDKYAVF